MTIKVSNGFFNVYNKCGIRIAVFKSMVMLLEYVEIMEVMNEQG